MPGLETEVIVLADGVERARHALGPGIYTIGRSSSCELQEESGGVSRQHARLTIGDDGSLVVEDLGSSHGTLLDGDLVTAPTPVAPNQSIQLGDIALLIQRRVADAPVEGAAAVAGDGIPPELREADRYQPGQELARGGMGAVLVARQSAIRRQVSMKVMLDDTQPRARMRFIEEAQITGQLEHPNIVPVHELAIDERGQPYYTMKLVKGTTLKKILDLLAEGAVGTVAKYPLASLLTIFQKVCDALAFAHSKGVIHRDLKPANVMVGSYGEVLVMDWGLAKVIGREGSPSVSPFCCGRNQQSARSRQCPAGAGRRLLDDGRLDHGHAAIHVPRAGARRRRVARRPERPLLARCDPLRDPRPASARHRPDGHAHRGQSRPR